MTITIGERNKQIADQLNNGKATAKQLADQWNLREDVVEQIAITRKLGWAKLSDVRSVLWAHHEGMSHDEIYDNVMARSLAVTILEAAGLYQPKPQKWCEGEERELEWWYCNRPNASLDNIADELEDMTGHRRTASSIRNKMHRMGLAA